MSNENKNKQDLDPASALGILGLVGAAVFYNKRAIIEAWVYDHMISIMMFGIVFFGVIGLLIFNRRAKKGEEEYRRRRNLEQVRASSKRPGQYYNQKRSDDEG